MRSPLLAFWPLVQSLFRQERRNIFEVQAGVTRFVWSRENGSVVAGLVKLEASSVADAQLTLDRSGRDDELTIGQDAWVEVTSPERQVRGLPGWIAQVKQVIDTELQVDWLAGAPADLDEVGETPLVRRWESAPLTAPTNGTYVDLESGIEVAFTPASGTPAPGDFWLIPARTSRLAYGIAATHGTIEWPGTSSGPAAMPPLGPVHHIASLAVLIYNFSGSPFEHLVKLAWAASLVLVVLVLALNVIAQLVLKRPEEH